MDTLLINHVALARAAAKAERAEVKRETASVEKARKSDAAKARQANAAPIPSSWLARPFIGIDGEGGGVDSLLRQNYLLMHAADSIASYDAECFHANVPLSTEQCFEFILALPAKAICVGYFFTYDATQILRDLPAERIARIFEPFEYGSGKSPYIYWRDYAIDFKPRQYFRVARAAKVAAPGDGMGSRYSKLQVVPGSARTVNEVGGFFQGPFVKQIQDWNVGTPEIRAMIAANKDRREQFVRINKRERAYCKAECELLAELMERFRETCADPDIMPATWRGAGAISAALHKRWDTPKRKELETLRSKRFQQLASEAYFGGRFEIARVGSIRTAVYEYDINSAYPAAMLHLPCPRHSHITRLKPGAALPSERHFLARITFDHTRADGLCGLPLRVKHRLLWPQAGSGVYWSPEIRAAIAAGARIVDMQGGYVVKSDCSCDSYQWVAELYRKRKSLGSQTRGYPLKLGINGLYGKLAQRLGGAPYRDMASAGLITSYTRSWLIDAYHSAPSSIIMLATDGVFSTEPLSTIELGDGIGQWEQKIRPDMFVVQPGIYWSSNSGRLPKTRGIPRSRIIEHRQQFEDVWAAWAAGDGDDTPPSIAVSVTSFVGHRLALARGKPELAGRWLEGSKNISFDWGVKRQFTGLVHNSCVTTLPWQGAYDMASEPYDRAMLSDLEAQIMEDEADDDYRPWGNSGE